MDLRYILEILAIIIGLIGSAIIITWTIGSKLGRLEKNIVKGQADNRLNVETRINTLKDYTDGKLMPLEKRVSHIEGQLEK